VTFKIGWRCPQYCNNHQPRIRNRYRAQKHWPPPGSIHLKLGFRDSSSESGFASISTTQGYIHSPAEFGRQRSTKRNNRPATTQNSPDRRRWNRRNIGDLSGCHPLKITSPAHKIEINIFGFIQFWGRWCHSKRKRNLRKVFNFLKWSDAILSETISNKNRRIFVQFQPTRKMAYR
jgi:hypothetical protein